MASHLDNTGQDTRIHQRSRIFHRDNVFLRHGRHGTRSRPEAPVAGTDGVLVLDTAQRCVSADTVFAHLFDLDASAFEGCALADTALPKP